MNHYESARPCGCDYGMTPAYICEQHRKPIEWVVLAERDAGCTIVRDGYATAGEAAAARRELERGMAADDTTNHLVLTRSQAEAIRAEDQVIR